MIISLPWKERRMISRVAKLFCDMAMRGEGYDERVRQFWRISLYVKAGILYYNDAKTILTAMEEFQEVYQDAPSHKDPKGLYFGMKPAIVDLRALVKKEEEKRNSKNASVSAKGAK